MSNMSLQECLARRKDCSDEGHALPLSVVKEICNSTLQAEPLKSLFIVLPNGNDYTGGIYRYNKDGLKLITDKEKTKHSMEVYPELIWKESIELEDLVRVGLSWQYLSLKAESMGFGVSQRARSPKSYNKLVNTIEIQKQSFLYSVAVRERINAALLEDTTEPLQKEVGEGTTLLDTPVCYKDRALYNNKHYISL